MACCEVENGKKEPGRSSRLPPKQLTSLLSNWQKNSFLPVLHPTCLLLAQAGLRKNMKYLKEEILDVKNGFRTVSQQYF